MQKTKPNVQETLNRLETGIRDFCRSDTYQTYLRTMARFHNYSFHNSILIAMQKPEATHVAGYTAWEKNFRRHVKKGERGIRILAPVPVKSQTLSSVDPEDPESPKQHLAFRLATVFDISQTEGEPLPDNGVHLLTGTVKNYDAFLTAIRNISDVPIAFENIPGGVNGYFSHSEQRIVIDMSLSETQILKTALHELSHSILHPDSDKDRRTKEVEAESTAFCVCDHFGLDTSDYSFGYIAGWSADKSLPELKASFQLIHNTASSVISSLEQELMSSKAA